MKKLISAAIVAVMLVSALCLSVSADLLWTDDFNSGVFSEADWRVEGSLFTLQSGGPTNSGHLEGYAEAVVQQSSYNDSDHPTPAPRVYGPNFAVKCDMWIFEDGGNDADEHWVALWWADHFEDQIGGDRIVYTVRCTYETRTVAIIVHGENGGTEYFDGDTTLSEWKIPDDVELEMDSSSPTVINLGMRINGTQIDGFFNGQKVVSATAPIIHQNICPILFWNGGCYTGFDNWMVSTADYDLFNEGAGGGQQGGGQQGGGQQGGQQGGAQQGGGTEKVIVKKSVVVGTDAEGNAITEIVTEEVVRQVAATGGNATGGNAAKTGDTAVIVIAVMIVALGAAIVVKKVSSR